MTTNFQVKAVTTPETRKMFLDLPAKVYANDPNWVSPLRSSVANQLALSVSNPFLEYGEFQPFVAVAAGQPLGRVVAAVNRRLIAKEGKNIGLFGYFECIEDFEVAQALLETANQWLRDRGMTLVRGPIDLSTHNNCLLLVEGFDSPPRLMMPYNPPYYPQFLEKMAWRKGKDAYAFDLPINQKLLDKFARTYRVACKAGVKFRPLNTKGEAFEEDCRKLYHLFTKAFTNNWSSSPRSEAEFMSEARDLQKLVDPKIFPIAEYEGEMIGFLMALPDYNIALKHVKGQLNWLGILKFLWYRRQIDRIRVVVICSLPEYRRKMVAPALAYAAAAAALEGKKTYHSLEMSWVWEDNLPSLKLIESVNSERYKTFRIYEKEL